MNVFFDAKAKAGFFLLIIFTLIFPLTELLFLNNDGENVDLKYFVLSQASFLSLSVFLYYFICKYFSKSSDSLNTESSSYFLHENRVQRVTLYLTILFFFLFLSFYLKNVTSISGVAFFAEQYRNGVYKGSGLYTFWMTQILPFILAVMVIRFRELNVFFYLTFLLLFIVTWLLGLRIILLVLYFFLFIRLLNSEHRIRSFIVLFILVFLFVFYKVFLNDSLSETSTKELLLHIAGRMRYRFLVYDSDFLFNLEQVFGFLPFINGELSAWKEFFTLAVPDISLNMPHISLFSGMAWPYPLIVFNGFGYFGFILCIPFALAFLFSLRAVYNNIGYFKLLLNLYICYFTFFILIEDVYQFDKLPLMVFFIIFIYFYFRFLSSDFVKS